MDNAKLICTFQLCHQKDYWIQELSGEYDYLLPNHNGVVIAQSYIQEFIELMEHIYAGDAVIEDKLNHRFIEMDPKAPELCRVRYKHASIFIKKVLLMEVYGESIITYFASFSFFKILC